MAAVKVRDSQSGPDHPASSYHTEVMVLPMSVVGNSADVLQAVDPLQYTS